MEIKLDGKRAVVTGGDSGIGAAISAGLAAAGAKVLIHYGHNVQAAQSVVQQIQGHGGEALAVQADVSDPQAVATLFDRVDQAWGGVDILVNSAGIDGVRAMAWEATVENWRKVIDINLMGVFYSSREALTRMVPQKGGVVLTITSVHEEIAWSGYSAYTASKSGVSMLTKTLAQEAAPYNVRVLAVAPGAIRTPINRNVWSDPEGLKDLVSKIPLGRIGEPEEVANMVVALVSDVGSYVTGCTILVDGGMTDYPEFAHGG